MVIHIVDLVLEAHMWLLSGRRSLQFICVVQTGKQYDKIDFGPGRLVAFIASIWVVGVDHFVEGAWLFLDKHENAEATLKFTYYFALPPLELARLNVDHEYK